MKKSIVIVLMTVFSLCSTMAQDPVYKLVDRISQGASKLFLFELTDQDAENDFFELDQKGGKVWIKGNNNISIATGLNWYLKYYAGVQITWNNPTAYLGKLPRVKTPERRSTDVLIRYYLNYCTFSYSMAFWDWNRWQQEIDFMALHGINMPLALTGTSTVWRNTLLKLGYTKDQANQFIAGPAHQAWFLMNNLQGAGGPNPDSYYENQEKLEKQIVERYKEWGIEPVYTGYAGMVPRDADSKLGLNIQDPGKWCGYDRPAFLQPEDPRFAEIAKVYYGELTALFGTANYYSIDPFHEGGSTKGVDLPAAGRAIYKALTQVNPNAVWVVQSWQSTPYQKMINEVPAGKILVLDLFSESRPQWGDTNSPWFRKDGFEHHDWVYCMLLNFGGNVGMYGKMQRVIDGYYLARNSSQASTLKGVGATPEGIENNPVMYELLYELPWRPEKFTKEQWLTQWTVARYGRTMPEIDQAWKIIANTAYNPPFASTQEGTTESVLCARPALVVERTSSWATAKLYYDAAEFEKALGLMLQVADKYTYSNNFKYDLTDVARQTISNRANVLLPQLLDAFDKGEKEKFADLSNTFLDLILLQDRLLSSRSEFMVGNWIEQAMKMGKSAPEHEFYRQAARQLITTWGNRTAANEGGLHDYSHREWNGLLRDFYYTRWKYFFDQINSTTTLPMAYDYYDMEQAWVMDKTPYDNRPVSDAIRMAEEVYIFLNNK